MQRVVDSYQLLQDAVSQQLCKAGFAVFIVRTFHRKSFQHEYLNDVHSPFLVICCAFAVIFANCFSVFLHFVTCFLFLNDLWGARSVRLAVAVVCACV